MFVRDMIKQACDRVNLSLGTQGPAPDVFQTGLLALKSVISKYNSDSSITFTQNSVFLKNSELIHIYDKQDTAGGEHNKYFDSEAELSSYILTEKDYEDEVYASVKTNWQTVRYSVGRANDQFIWIPHILEGMLSPRDQQIHEYWSMEHVKLHNVEAINSIYLQPPEQRFADAYELKYVNHTDFDRYTASSRVYTWIQRGQGEWIIRLKPIPASMNWNLKLNYNRGIEFDEDKPLYLPDNYIQLLIAATAHKLALEYPRLDDAQMQRLENDVRVMLENVRTPRAESRALLRSDYWTGERYDSVYDLIGGTGL